MAKDKNTPYTLIGLGVTLVGIFGINFFRSISLRKDSTIRYKEQLVQYYEGREKMSNALQQMNNSEINYLYQFIYEYRGSIEVADPAALISRIEAISIKYGLTIQDY